MRKLAIAMALASTALATPAVARDHSFYVGLEGGVMWVEDMRTRHRRRDANAIRGSRVDHNTGYDVDAIAGYDFGGFALEGELGYKQAGHRQRKFVTTDFPAGGMSTTTSLSVMGNVLLDFGNENGFSGYVGGGVGMAAQASTSSRQRRPDSHVDFNDSRQPLRMQAIAGVRYAISQNIDVGLKYRYFNVSR